MDGLSLEVVENILKHIPGSLAPKELSNTLRNCCLVSYSWKSIAQPLLFSTLPLYRYHHNHKKLYQTLLSYPHFRRFIRSIWIDSAVLACALDIGLDVENSGHLLDASNPKSIITLLNILTSTKHFHHLILYCDFDEVEPLTQIDSSIISSSNLTVVSFVNIDGAPIRVLYQLTALRELHLCSSEFTGFEEGQLEEEERTALGWSSDTLNIDRDWQQKWMENRPRLVHLYLEDLYNEDSAILEWFLHADCAFDLSELKTFHFLDQSTELGSYKLGLELVKKVSSSIEDFALAPHTWVYEEKFYRSMANYTPVDPLPQLRRLKLSFQSYDVTERSPFPWVVHFLSGLAHSERLEELQICCSFVHYTAEKANKDHGWEELDSYLMGNPTGHRTFSNLKVVWFGILSSTDEEEQIQGQQLIEKLPSFLPGLAESGILKFSISKHSGYVQDSDCWHG